MSRAGIRRFVVAIWAAILFAPGGSAGADLPEPEISPNIAAIQKLVDDWYVEQCAGDQGRPYRLMAPGGIEASPAYTYLDKGSAALGPRVFVALAATIPLFRYEVTQIRADARFAKIRVRERGYRYASAAKVTYERMSDTLLVVERQDDGRWLVLAHQTSSTGFHPSLGTTPLPDLGPDAQGQDRPTPEPRCERFRPDEFVS
ncbi:hypothetical protein ACO2Q1_09910 [Brevundimonas sp. VNH65]|uniref:hypothetical protein n=1 Tax=Brevundimonas sp. VNH65 TaxID=3400917 RepID=UPI003C059EB6